MARMRTTNFDAIATSAPLDKTASVVRDGTGEHWDPSVKDGRLHWVAPPPCGVRPAHAPDLVGCRVGRLTVVGYYDKGSKNGGGSRWVVRCTCGAYETRRSKAIRNPRPRDDGEEQACFKCETLIHARRIQSAASRGKWSDGRRFDLVGLRTQHGDRRLKDPEPA